MPFEQVHRLGLFSPPAFLSGMGGRCGYMKQLPPLAEHWYGAARDADDFLLVDAGEGIGCALMNGGRIDTSRRYIGGELGHTVLNPKGDLCGCGRRGCLETVASLSAILKRSGGAPAVSGAGSPCWRCGGVCRPVTGQPCGLPKTLAAPWDWFWPTRSMC